MLKSARRWRGWIWAGGVLGTGLAVGCAAPVLAQVVVDQVIVTGRYPVGPQAQSLSAPVSYADLDLTTDAGRDVLKDRVRVAAEDLCRRLGESGASATGAVPSCEQTAIDGAQAQERVAVASARRPVYAIVMPPPAADAPYVAPAGTSPAAEAAAAPAYGQSAAATVTTQTVTNGAVRDTPENRARYGPPMSNAGRRTSPAGN